MDAHIYGKREKNNNKNNFNVLVYTIRYIYILYSYIRVGTRTLIKQVVCALYVCIVIILLYDCVFL